MENTKVYKIKDTNFKHGKVICKCGYNHNLGNGFNIYYIKNCPRCTKILNTRNQRKVIYFDKNRNSLKADIGTNIYFVLSNGIHIRYETKNINIYYGTERYLDNL